jgi:hypothetical protein
MERHVERLIAACGLAQFSYRAWPTTEILPPSRPAPEPAAPAAAPEAGILLLAVPAEPPVAAAPSPADSRARSLFASLAKFIEEPEPRGLAPAEAAAGRPARPRGPLSLPPPEGFEPPIHVGYRAARRSDDPPRQDRRGAAASPAQLHAPPAPARRFALLDEVAGAVPRRMHLPDRRAPPPPGT